MRIADKGTRFGNYILDTIGFFIIIMLHAFILDGLLHVIPEDGSPLLGIYYFVLYFGYHFLFEYFFGRTPGKFITNTRVTDFDGQKPTAKELFIRNICRLIPFDNLSFLFGDKGWHDSISETQVVYVDKRQ
jgi:uncharacterized RDD family membrane protein YckC